MNIYEEQSRMLVQTAAAYSSQMARAKAIAFEAAQALSGTARERLLAYAMTGSALASIVIVAAPLFEVLHADPGHSRLFHAQPARSCR
jgi:hypothetical protein